MGTLHETWNRFVTRHDGSFLQSWEWGEFQESIGRRVHRFAGDQNLFTPLGNWGKKISNFQIQNFQIISKSQNPEIEGLIQCVEMPLPFGLKYWYGARGPVVDESRVTDHESWERTIAALGKNAVSTHNLVFLRFDPAWKPEHKDAFISNGWRQTADIQPRRNWVLDVGGPDEALLEGLHPKTRYNVRLAEKNGVRIRQGDAADDFDGFWRLTEETRERHGIRSHRKRYYKEMLAMPIAELWQAEHNGTVIASHIMIFFGNRATYLHGASSYADRSLMAPYLLHWTVIREARKRGFIAYDFGGVDEMRWPGITRFKQGFGGKEEAFAGTFDFPLRPWWYGMYDAGRAFMGKK